MRHLVCFFALLFIIQSPSDADSDTEMTVAPRVFIDCRYCDEEYIRTEIPYVDFVWERKEADIHILITRQSTGGRGKEYTVAFLGLDRFATLNDTLKMITAPGDTEDQTREALVRTLTLGLTRYLARTALADNISIAYSEEAEVTEPHDPWNSWVFSISLNSYLNGQKSSNQISLYSRASAERVTDSWKLHTNAYLNYSESKFDFGSYEYASFTRSQSLRFLAVRSIDDHWSVGGTARVSSSTYSNIDVRGWVAPAVEFNIYPYSESTRREFRLLYELGASRTAYSEETIYGKTSEWLAAEELSVTLEQTQPWGSAEVTFVGSHYFHDLGKYRLMLYGDLSLQLIKGLSLNVYGSGSRIHDQISLPKGTATDEEVLLQRKQLATSYDYWGSFGFTYTFGSIFSSVVNPRFGS